MLQMHPYKEYTAHPDSRWKRLQCKHRPEQSHTFNQTALPHVCCGWWHYKRNATPDHP